MLKLLTWNFSLLPLKCTLRAAWKCTIFPKTIHQSYLGGNFTTLSLQALHFPYPRISLSFWIRFWMPLYWENGKILCGGHTDVLSTSPSEESLRLPQWSSHLRCHAPNIESPVLITGQKTRSHAATKSLQLKISCEDQRSMWHNWDLTQKGEGREREGGGRKREEEKRLGGSG